MKAQYLNKCSVHCHRFLEAVRQAWSGVFKVGPRDSDEVEKGEQARKDKNLEDWRH
ncbi:hypothetical protein D9M69_253710 [compost metagenome]